MCGLIAWLSAGGWPTGALRQATGLIRDRGPDDGGFVTWTGRGEDEPQSWTGPDSLGSLRKRIPPLPGTKAARIALGHRRLSIVDLSDAGHQPMPSRDRTCWVAYNGEIYNHVELRLELDKSGHRFSSASDTEVLLAAWQQRREDCLARFNGMFVFVLLDTHHNLLLASGDRFGVKPLYVWAAADGTIVFASEIKQLTALPGWRSLLNGPRVYDIPNWRLLDHSPETCFQGVLQVPSGHRVLIELSRFFSRHEPCSRGMPIHPQEWYSLRPRSTQASTRESAKWFREVFTDAVRLRLRADVPVGSFLSGGLDSSATVCVASGLLQGTHGSSQRTYSAGSSNPRFDESPWARIVVDHAGVDAHFVYPEPDGFADMLPQLVWHHDKPLDSHAIYAYGRLMERVRADRIKVILNGQGADEQLAGYAPFLDVRLAGLLRRLKLAVCAREVWSFAASQNRSVAELTYWALGPAAPDVARRAVRSLTGTSRPSWLAGEDSWISPKIRSSVRARGAAMFSGSASCSSVGQPADATHYEDRLSMAHSVEVRVPFLDYRLVEGVTGLPEAHKLSRGQTKLVLREAMRGLLPEAVRTRPDKQGFITPN